MQLGPLLFYLRLLLFVQLLPNLQISAQVKWDGEGGDGQWTNKFNWVGDSLPIDDSDIILDHFYEKGPYTVFLPSGNISITVKSIRINGGENFIMLVIPSSNTAVPGLKVTGRGYSIHIGSKAVFINASGASSGQPLQVSDSIRIDNGGKFVHRTSRSHAAHVTMLSIAPGTETGIFQFDIPDASATISLSDRRFGTLQLSAHSAPGKINYTASGTRKIHVRGDLIIDTAVSLSLNFSDTFFIDGNFIQQGGTFNCATSTRPLVVALAGNFFQLAKGVITESGMAVPTIVLNGKQFQLIRVEGAFNNSVLLIIKNAGSRLLAPLSLSYKLKLISGIIKTADTALLRLLPGSEIISDSTIHSSFIEGPVQKMGMVDTGFLFPVGKDGIQRWMVIKGISGNIQVEFVKESPQGLSNNLGSGLHHISSVEYWKVTGDPISNSRIELSFDNVNSGGVTELSSLRVAQLIQGRWIDEGNSATTGSAGSAGSVWSEVIGEHELETRYFTLAAVSAQNPLPYETFHLSGSVVNNAHLIEWIYDAELKPPYFVIETSVNNFLTISEKIVDYVEGQKRYSYKNAQQPAMEMFYRIRAQLPSQQTVYSGIIRLNALLLNIKLKNSNGFSGDQIFLDITSNKAAQYHVRLTNNMGKLLEDKRVAVFVGLNTVRIYMGSYARGIYYLTVMSDKERKVFSIIR